MNQTNRSERVNDLYIKNDTLSTRIGLHDRYSVNPYGWSNWVFDQYDFHEGARVLELGCGTGGVWFGRTLPKGVQVTLTDLSKPLLEKAERTLGENHFFRFRPMDIQDIDFPDASFDAVIANHMLYHVPDIERGLSEAVRVLASKGTFYATTLGENSLLELQEVYEKFEGKGSFSYSENVPFTLEKGYDILKKHFEEVALREYIDSLVVTNADDLLAYVKSYNIIPEEIESEFFAALENRFDENGIFRIRKEQGMFICRK